MGGSLKKLTYHLSSSLSNVVIHHQGYADPALRRPKRERNLRLLAEGRDPAATEQALRELLVLDPQHPLARQHLPSPGQ